MSLLQMSFAGAVMILAIIVIRVLVINLLPKKTFLGLWGIAAVRLLIPFSIPSAFSVYPLISNHIPATAPAKVPQAFEMLLGEINGQVTAMPGSFSNTVSPISVWTMIWGVGALVCVLVFAIAYWKCRQEFQTSLPVDNDFIKGWLSTHQLKRTISIRQSSRFSAPLTYGVLRPVILMPTSTNWKNTTLLQYVLAHEYVHIQRFDSITKLVLIAVLCVHWFNPLVWAMYVLANRDVELSCDEAVADAAIKRSAGTFKKAFGPVLKLIEKAGSLEELRDMMENTETVAEVFKEMDVTDVEELLQKVMIYANLEGRAVEYGRN